VLRTGAELHTGNVVSGKQHTQRERVKNDSSTPCKDRDHIMKHHTIVFTFCGSIWQLRNSTAGGVERVLGLR